MRSTNPRFSTLSACVGMTLALAAADISAQGTSSGSTGGTSATSSNSGAMSGANSGGNAALSSADKKFVDKAAIGGLAEVEMGKLAQQKAANDQVKQFGTRMVDDHTKSNDELKQVASSKGITLPTGLDSKHKSVMDRFEKLSGAQFDRAYIDYEVSDHKEDISDFQKEAKSGHDSDVKGFAAKTVPTLQEHLTMAQATDKVVKNTK